MMYIMNPSMILTWFFGVLLVLYLEIYNQLWLNLKFVSVFLMSVFHMYCARIRKNFEKKINEKDEKYFRWINEVPTILFLVIIFLVVFQPKI
jgi:putative membrane protein